MAINFLDSINIRGLNGGVALNVQGSQGQLFSVTDDLSGNIFAVADISGVPILSVNSNGTSFFDGKLGIGTALPDQKLEVLGDIRIGIGSAGKIVFGSSGSTPGDYLELNDVNASGSLLKLVQDNSVKFVVQGVTGNVGIGTTLPSEKLYVASTAGFIATFQSTTATDFRPIRWINSSGQNVGFLGNNGSTNEFSLIAQDRPLLFGTGNGGAERMRISSTGNVGIGTSNPSAKLHVVGATKLLGGQFSVSSDTGMGNAFTYAFRDAVGINNPNSVSAPSVAGYVMTVGRSTAGSVSGGIYVEGESRFVRGLAGAIKFNAYSAGTLVSDASGNITAIGGGGAGGPFLPLAGGTMTGDITFNNSVRSLKWEHTSGQSASRAYAWQGEQGAYGRFALRSSNAADNIIDTDVLYFDNDLSATFAGTINSGALTSTGNITTARAGTHPAFALNVTGIANTTNAKIRLGIVGIDNGGLSIRDETNSRDWIRAHPTGAISMPSGALSVTGAGTFGGALSVTGAGTFAGNITISNASPALNLTDTDNASNIAFSSVGGALIVNSTTDQIYQIGGTEKFRIASSLATFAGGISAQSTVTINKSQATSALTINSAGDGGWTQYASTQDGIYGYIGSGSHLLAPVVNDNDFVIRAQKEFAVSIAAIEKFRINASGNSIFAGDITLGDDLNFTTNGFADISNTGTGAMRFKPSSQTLALTLTGANATFAGKATSLATSASDGSTTLATKSYVDGIITGVPVYKGTWAAGTTAITSAAISTTNITLAAPTSEAIAVGDIVTADGITSVITVAAIISTTSVTVSSAVTIAINTIVTFSPAGGYPDLTSVGNKVLGNYYIVSTAGSATPNGSGTEPDSWAVGDWCIFSDVTPGAGTDLWQRIDNSSVISGAGTGQRVALWEGATNADSETLTNAPITVDGNNTTFAGTVTATGNAILNGPQTIFNPDSNSQAKILSVGTDAIALFASSGDGLYLGGGGTTNLYLDASTNANFSGDVTIAEAALLSHQQNTDVDGLEIVAQVLKATYTAAFFDFVVKKGTNVRSGTVYACHDGTSAQFTETSTQDLGDTSDVVLSVDVSGAVMRLLANAATAGWSVKSLVKAI